MKLLEKFLKRYEKQILLNEIKLNGQKNIIKSKILCIGAGGLASTVLPYLTASGVGKIGIVESDKIELSNLQRQIIYNTYQIGLKKSTCIKEFLKKINPNVEIIIYQTKLQKTNMLNIVKNFDLLIDCTDNIKTKELLNKLAIMFKIPLIYGTASNFSGQVCVFNYNNGPCYACLYQKKQIQEKQLLYNCNEGVLGPVPGLIGCLQAIECLKILIKKNDTCLNGILLTIDVLTMTFYKHQFKKKKNCKICSKSSKYQSIILNPNLQRNTNLDTNNKIYTLKEFNQVKHFSYIIKITSNKKKKFEKKKNSQIVHISLKTLYNNLTMKKLTKNITKKAIIFIYCTSGIKSNLAFQIFLNNYKYINIFKLQQ